MELTTIVILLANNKKNSDEADYTGPKRRGRLGPTGVIGEAASRKRTRRPRDTRTQTSINTISKAVGRGVERLASTTARGVCYQSLLGLSVPQGSVGLLAQEQPSWIEERVQVETRREMGSSAPQRVVVQENTEDNGEALREIPGVLTQRERSMLLTTQAERERGGVRIIKCNLCPNAKFGSWETFRRHCKECEKHPVELHYCDRCGDYFARSDSKNRHENTKEEAYLQACHKTPPHVAKMKKEKIGLLFKAFDARLSHCLEGGEEIWPMFSEAASRLLTNICGNTSKKVSNKEQTSFEGTWAAGLCA